MNKNEPLETIPIIVEFSRRRAGILATDVRLQDELRRQAARYLEQLVSDLAIPVKVSFLLQVRDISPHRVTIDGLRCRLSVLTLERKDTEPEELVHSVATALYENRQLLLPARLTYQLYEAWLWNDTAPHLKGMSFVEFDSLLLQLIRHYRSITRSKEKSLPTLERSQYAGAQEIFEHIVTAEHPRIGVTLSKEQHRALFGHERAGTRYQRARDRVSAKFREMQEELFNEFGFFFPEIIIEGIDPTLGRNEFQLRLNDLRLPPFKGLPTDTFLVDETVEGLKLLGLTGDKAFNPADGRDSVLVQGKDAVERCREKKLTTWEAPDFVVLSVRGALRRNPGAFLIRSQVEYNLDILRDKYPALDESVKARIGMNALSGILREMVNEGLSIGDLRSICERLLAIGGTTDVDTGRHIVFFSNLARPCPVRPAGRAAEPADYADFVRIFSRRDLSNKYSGGNNTLIVYRLSKKLEARVRLIDKRPLSETEHQKMIQEIAARLSESVTLNSQPVIMTAMDVRRRVRTLIEKEFPWLPVMAYEERAPNKKVQVIGEISG